MWNEAVIFRVDRGKYYTVTDDKGASDFAARVKRETARIVFFGTLQELRSLLQQPIPNLFEEPNDAS